MQEAAYLRGRGKAGERSLRLHEHEEHGDDYVSRPRLASGEPWLCLPPKVGLGRLRLLPRVGLGCHTRFWR
jgi:hypothetical protein